MANQIYALLVGINQYSESQLSGCINDINAMQDWLTTTFSNTGNLHIKRLTDSDTDATFPGRSDIIAAFETHFAQADNQDICLFYFSGHGINLTAPSAFADQSAGAVQALLCRDWVRKINQNGNDTTTAATETNTNTAITGYIIDKELSYLIWKTKLDKPDMQFVVITDCCHSGSATRGIEDEGMQELEVKVRGLDIVEASPDVTAYLGHDYTTDDGKRAYEVDENGKLVVQSAPHIHFGAAKDDEEAVELIVNADSTHHGAFSYGLNNVLKENGGKLSYQQLHAEASNKLKNVFYKKANIQEPSLNAIGSNVYKFFLSNDDYNGGNVFSVYYSKKYGWCVNAGLMLAVSEGDEVVVQVSNTATKQFKVVQSGLLFSIIAPQDATDTLSEMNEKAFYNNVQIATRKLLPSTDAKSKWEYLKSLDNKATQLKNSFNIKVECANGYDGTNYTFQQGSTDQLNVLQNISYPGKRLFPSFKVTLENTGEPILYFSFAYLDSDYNIIAYDEKNRFIDREVASGLPQPLSRIGLENSKEQPVVEYLKIFVSDKMPIPLYGLVQQIKPEDKQTRGIASDDDEAAPLQLDDWATVTIGFQIPPKTS